MPVIKPYCNSLHTYSRFLSREVKVGAVGIGGNNPIRLQSMTTTDTLDTAKTVAQSIRMIEAGCELVRITAPSLNEAKNLEQIKKELRRQGFETPIIADIHFTPNAAEYAARIIEKVRVNPGNYADKKKFEHIDYTETSYEAEIDRIRKRFSPLVKICKEYGTAMRIGTNHGSLSDRILSRYGDTPLGMVESAIEFLEICEEHNYHDVILSMKASNTLVMVQAYRMLVQRMIETGRNYPLHLGVTEAGEGEDGRIKSAVGIGTLLEDGLGDTIRVSLTEEPEFEIPVARELVKRYTIREEVKTNPPAEISLPYDPLSYQRGETIEVMSLGAHNVPRIVVDFSTLDKITPASLFAAGYSYSVSTDKWNLSDQACDFIYAGEQKIDFEIPGTLRIIYKKDLHTTILPAKTGKPVYYLADENFVSSLSSLDPNAILILHTESPNSMSAIREMCIQLKNKSIHNPVIIRSGYTGITLDQVRLYASTDLGGLLLDGFGDGIWIDACNGLPRKELNSLAFGILQATRTRISKTEYISCPSCGRTLFDLQETTAKIRNRTHHLKGVKIGIMGCIVNGPGEMADADYGYVGTGIGKITLYKGKEVVERNIDSEKAVDALIELIRKHGDWVESPGEIVL
jgi:(E)-4-hydroxy-3-methylbut-2-enyl-diphosphate synthase